MSTLRELVEAVERLRKLESSEMDRLCERQRASAELRAAVREAHILADLRRDARAAERLAAARGHAAELLRLLAREAEALAEMAASVEAMSAQIDALDP